MARRGPEPSQVPPVLELASHPGWALGRPTRASMSFPAAGLVPVWVLPFPDATASSWNLRDMDHAWLWANPDPPGPPRPPWRDFECQKGLLVLM